MTQVTITNSQTRVNREFKGMTFVFRADGYLNMTKAAAAYGKRLDNFVTLPSTVDYVAALSKALKISELEITQAQAGRYGGTWCHPKMAVSFARWLDAEFAVFCDMTIDDLLNGHSIVNVVNPQKAVAPQLPQTYLESLQELIESVKEQERLKAETQRLEGVVAKKNAKLVEQAPKVEYVEKYMEADGSLGIQAAARVLQCNMRELGHWLVDKKLAFRAQPANTLMPYATTIDRGLMVVKVGLKSGGDASYQQLKITNKGMTYLRENLPAYVYKTYN